MTRDELIDRLQGMADRAANDSAKVAFAAAATLAEQLDSQPAMAWQDEPSIGGWHWVEGITEPVRLVLREVQRAWYMTGFGCYLQGRRVCPIPAPPPLPKRGEVDLAKHCEAAAKIVATWPAWKRGILGHSTEPTNSVPRSPVDNQSNLPKRGDK